MDVRAAHQLLDRCHGDDPRAVLEACQRLTLWIEHRRLTAVRELAANPAVSPQHTVAEIDRTSLTGAHRVVERADTVAALPAFDTALQAGAVTTAHLDVLAAGMRRLPEPQRQLLAEHDQQLASAATHLSVGKFRDLIDREVRQLETDGGLGRFEQQRRNTRLHTWTGNDGMYCGRFQLDPESGARVATQLRDTIESLFHDRTPDTAPADPIDKHAHLAALAFVAIVNGHGTTNTGRAAIGIIIDHDTLLDHAHQHGILDAHDMPVATVRRLLCDADIYPIVLNSKGIVTDLGNGQRLASRGQRRALHAMFPTCFIPGCDTPFEHCDIHHIRPWGTFRRTNLNDLRPVCNRHHHALHEGQWTITIDGWQVTITRPDGTTIIADPPRQRRPAA
jgi:hypothetical protein